MENKRLTSKIIIFSVAFGLLIFLVISLFAATPNPGHPWSQVGDGQWAATGTTAYHTYTFPDTTTTILTTNAAVTVAQGGSGTTTFTQSDLVYATALNTLGALPSSTAATRYVSNTGGSNAPLWAQVNLANGIVGSLSNTANGGTGLTSFAQGDLLYASAANVLSALTKNASSTTYLANTGTSNAPQWNYVNLANGVTGNLATTSLNSGTSAASGTFWRGDGTWASAGLLVSAQVFTSGVSSTYSRPAGITEAVFELVGGGGGGGGAQGVAASNCGAGGGGGGGGYAIKMCTNLAASESYTVGQGGAGGATTGGQGGTGTSTTITCNGTATTTALGGVGGIGDAGGTSARVTAGSAGGLPTGGDVNIQGNAGNYGSCASGTTHLGSGGGGRSVLGGGAIGKTAASAGTAGSNYGGGGSGALTLNSTDRLGGAGMAGIIIVWEFK